MAGKRSPAPESESIGRATGSRDRLIEAAARLARERGVDGATISALCKRSGLPVSSVYWHFTDKDALFAEVIRTDYERWIAQGPDWVPDPTLDFADDLRNMMTAATAHTVAQMPDFIRIGMQLVLDQRDANEQARAEFLKIRAEVARLLHTWCHDRLAEEQGSFPAGLAGTIGALMFSYSDGLLVGAEIYEDWDTSPYLEIFVQSVAAMVDAARERE